MAAEAGFGKFDDMLVTIGDGTIDQSVGVGLAARLELSAIAAPPPKHASSAHPDCQA